MILAGGVFNFVPVPGLASQGTSTCCTTPHHKNGTCPKTRIFFLMKQFATKRVIIPKDFISLAVSENLGNKKQIDRHTD